MQKLHLYKNTLMGTVKKMYIHKETVKNNHISDKCRVQPDTVFEAILQDEGHMTQQHTPTLFLNNNSTRVVGFRIPSKQAVPHNSTTNRKGAYRNKHFQ